MKLIVGLGNPGIKYKNTFHNLGFMAADRLAEIFGEKFGKEKCRALVAEFFVNGEKTVIAKPQTFMNLSGESVRELVDFYKIPTQNLLVIYDDFDLFKGEIRIREKGSAGTHNGMRNIIKELGHGDFPRIRLGFKPEGEFNVPLLDYVLSGIKEEDEKTFGYSIDCAAKAARSFAEGSKIQEIMQKYNGKKD